MKILEQTPARLTLRDRGVMLWLTFAAMAIAGIGIMPLGKHTIFSCQRASTLSAQCTLQEKSFLVSTRRPIPPSSIRGVLVVRHARSRRSDTYSVVMQTAGRRITLSSGSSSYSRQEAIANQVNNFLMDNTQPAIQVENDDRLLTLILGGVFGTTGIVGLLSICEINLCQLDRSTRTLRHTRQGAIGQKQTVLPLHQIAYAEVERGTGKGRSSGRVVLKLTSGDRFPLTRNHYPGLSHKEKVAGLITDFVMAPSADAGPELAAPPKRAPATPPPKDPEAAIALYQATLQTNPNDAETHYRLGMTLYKQHNIQDAATHLKRARELFEAKHQSHRVLQVQDMLWRLKEG
ncbi:MAG: hypothetical protein OHK0035_35670 [Cyanobacteria bacterium J069]